MAMTFLDVAVEPRLVRLEKSLWRFVEGCPAPTDEAKREFWKKIEARLAALAGPLRACRYDHSPSIERSLSSAAALKAARAHLSGVLWGSRLPYFAE